MNDHGLLMVICVWLSIITVLKYRSWKIIRQLRYEQKQTIQYATELVRIAKYHNDLNAHILEDAIALVNRSTQPIGVR